MSVQVRRRRESAAFLATYVGAQAELLVDTTNYRLQVHDGSTPGGFPAAKLSEVITNTRTAVADANYTANVGDRTIAFTSLSAARSLTLPPAAAYPTGTRLAILDEGGSCSLLAPIGISAVGSDTINGATGLALARSHAAIALTSDGVGRWTIADQPNAVNSVSSVRQTVLAGPLAGGVPSLFPSNGASLSLSTQGVAPASPLIVTAASGFNAMGVSDNVFAFTGNLTFALAANVTNYLYVDARTGAPGATTLPPIYQFGGILSVVEGQFSFDFQAMVGAIGNGTSAVPAALVFLGEAVAGASSVVSSITYAYNGVFDSGYLAALPAGGTALSRAHNLGSPDVLANVTAKCLNAEGGYAVGQVLGGLLTASGGAIFGTYAATTRLAASVVVGSSGFAAVNPGSGAMFTMTPANWAPRLVVRRGWGGV